MFLYRRRSESLFGSDSTTSPQPPEGSRTQSVSVAKGQLRDLHPNVQKTETNEPRNRSDEGRDEVETEAE